MPDPIWYYAQDDVQKDPVPAHVLWAMARSGQLRPHDLVWKEGMDDWVVASEIRGLFDKETDGEGSQIKQPVGPNGPMPEAAMERSPKAPDRVADASAGSSRSSAPAAPQKQVPAAAPVRRTEGGGRWAVDPSGAVASPEGHGPPAALSAAGPSHAPAIRQGPQLPSAPLLATSPVETARRTAAAPARLPNGPLAPRLVIAAAVVGLWMVVAARGCDGLAARNAVRLQALAERAENRFQYEWDRERHDLESRQAALRDKGNLSPADQGDLQFLADERTRLDEDRTRQRDELRRGEWKQLQETAAEAKSSARTGGYVRQWVYLAGSLLLVTSLAGLSILSRGADRNAAIALLALAAVACLFFAVPEPFRDQPPTP